MQGQENGSHSFSSLEWIQLMTPWLLLILILSHSFSSLEWIQLSIIEMMTRLYCRTALAAWNGFNSHPGNPCPQMHLGGPFGEPRGGCDPRC